MKIYTSIKSEEEKSSSEAESNHWSMCYYSPPLPQPFDEPSAAYSVCVAIQWVRFKTGDIH